MLKSDRKEVVLVIKEKAVGLNARGLQWIALFLMLLDHGGYILGKLIHPAVFFYLHCIGRLAFPIFAFQIAEGCVHTSNWKKYALRIFVFGLISEIPFNMMHTGMNFRDPTQQNVMFTLLLGLLSLRLLLWARERNWGYKLLGVAVFAAAYLAADWLCLDYGGTGVAVVVMFGLSGSLKYKTAVQILCLFLLNYAHLLKHDALGMPVQLLATFAMVPIALYNGKQGAKNKALQYGAYLFYPAHISVLVILRYLLIR